MLHFFHIIKVRYIFYVMNKLLSLLLLIILLIVGSELFLLLRIKSQIKTVNNPVIYPTKSFANTTIRTDWESWIPSEVRTYKNKTYGEISSALVKIDKVTDNTLVAELKNKDQINFQYDRSLEFFDRKESQQTIVEQKPNLKGFPIETGQIYLIEWLGNPKENNKLWRISRLVL